MSDKDKGPVWHGPRDRDVLVRKDTPAKGVPEFVSEELTDQYEIGSPELADARRTKRSTAQRLEHLENKYDRLVHQVLRSRTKIIVALVGAAGTIIGYLLGACA